MTIINSLIRGANRHFALVDIASSIFPKLTPSDLCKGNDSCFDEPVRTRPSPFGCACDTGIF